MQDECKCEIVIQMRDVAVSNGQDSAIRRQRPETMDRERGKSDRQDSRWAE